MEKRTKIILAVIIIVIIILAIWQPWKKKNGTATGTGIDTGTGSADSGTGQRIYAPIITNTVTDTGTGADTGTGGGHPMPAESAERLGTALTCVSKTPGATCLPRVCQPVGGKIITDPAQFSKCGPNATWYALDYSKSATQCCYRKI